MSSVDGAVPLAGVAGASGACAPAATRDGEPSVAEFITSSASSTGCSDFASRPWACVARSSAKTGWPWFRRMRPSATRAATPVSGASM